MEIHRAETDELINKKGIGGEFQETIGIAPGLQRIYVLISCQDSVEIYKSPVYEVGKADQYIHPIDLGAINLSTTGHSTTR